MLELIENAMRAEPGAASEILNHAGILGLTDQSGIDEIETALRQLRPELVGADALREAAVRTEATKHLMKIGLQAPAQLVSAALIHPEQEEETNRIAFSEPDPWAQPVDGALFLMKSPMYCADSSSSLWMKSRRSLYGSSTHMQ